MEKIVLIGAGSAMFTRGLVADLIDLGWEAQLALVDIDPAALRVAEKLAQKMLAVRQSPVKLSASVDRRRVLKGATAVICTIGVGGRRAWEQDVFVPRKYGIFQPVGDTAMPGGSSRALRMIPAMVDIARDVLDLAPDANFFNYGNPMSPTCRGIRKATGANVVGLCHGVHDVARYLARVLDVPHAELKHTAVGINHLTWFIALSRGGVDLMPRLASMAEARRKLPLSQGLATGFMEAGGRRQDPVACEDNPFSWEMTRIFGAFPAVMDRHACEFFPQFFADGSYYGMKLGKDAFSFEGVIDRGDQIYARMAEIAESPQPMTQQELLRESGEHEQVLDIIQSLRANSGRVFSVNLPNSGQVPNLPPDAVIECPGKATSCGLLALPVGPMPAALAGTLATRFGWVETIVEAALEGSRQKFIQALILDGSVRNIEQVEKLADELLRAQARYLPQFEQP
jgi:alpha-galactosidase